MRLYGLCSYKWCTVLLIIYFMTFKVNMFVSRNSFKTNDSDNEETQLFVTFSVCILFIGIGVPIWWKTTNVYRADLPFHDINKLYQERNLTMQVFVELIATNTSLDTDSFEKDLLQLLMTSSSNEPSVKVLYQLTTYQTAHAKVESSFEYISSRASMNTIQIIFSVDNQVNYDIKISNQRTVLCRMSNEVSQSNPTLKRIQLTLSSLIKQLIVQEDMLNEIVSNINRERDQFTFDHELMEMVQSNPKFELLFSLLCPEPDVQLANWNAKHAINLYFDSMLQKLKPVFDFHVNSQILYYTKIPYRPKVQRDASNKIIYYYLTPGQLSHVINPIEGRLGSQVSTDPTLNFVVYVTEKKFQPLKMKKQDGNFSRSNSFLVPRWGAMTFYNTLNGTVDMKNIMNPFLAHFRKLLGIQNLNQHFSDLAILHDEPNTDAVADWELDYLIRMRTLENIASSTHTLVSLANLLSKISNIVITDSIGRDVYRAADAVVKAKAFLATGKLSHALNMSKIAFSASESAFFDPTLLELLYFPEDQKFAIYIPLFLPISLPIVISLLYAIKRVKQKYQKTKTE